MLLGTTDPCQLLPKLVLDTEKMRDESNKKSP